MSKYANLGAIVNKPDALTHKKPCVIIKYDKSAKKYMVEFDGGWVGWYKLKELKVEPCEF